MWAATPVSSNDILAAVLTPVVSITFINIWKSKIHSEFWEESSTYAMFGKYVTNNHIYPYMYYIQRGIFQHLPQTRPVLGDCFGLHSKELRAENHRKLKFSHDLHGFCALLWSTQQRAIWTRDPPKAFPRLPAPQQTVPCFYLSIQPSNPRISLQSKSNPIPE